jgi:hypothetical protein
MELFMVLAVRTADHMAMYEYVCVSALLPKAYWHEL